MSDQIVPGGASEDVLDALASAYLDGAATDTERARVESEPALQERLVQFRAVRQQLADPLPAPVQARDEHLAAALAAFGTPELAPVTALAAARAKRSRVWAPLAAAAAVAVLFVGVGVAALRGDDSGTPTAARDGESSDSTPQAKTGAEAAQPPSAQDQFSVAATTAAAAPASEDGARSETVAGGSSEDAITMAAAAPMLAPVEVGSSEELTSVVDHALTGDLDSDASTTLADSNLEQARCSTEGELLMEVVWQGIDAVLYVVPSIADPQQAVVYDLTTCVELVRLPI